jgi:hypothetical protein
MTAGGDPSLREKRKALSMTGLPVKLPDEDSNLGHGD